MSTAFINIPLAQPVYASEQVQMTVDQIKEKIANAKKIELTLDELITLAIKDNTNLARLTYQKELMELGKENIWDQSASLASQISNLNSSIRDLEASLKDDKLDEATKENINSQIRQLKRQRSSAIESLDSLNAQILEYENQINQSESFRKSAEEGVRYMIIATYVGLEEFKDGISLQEKQLKQKQDEVRKQEKLYQVGNASRSAVTKAKRELEKLQNEVKNLKKQYDLQFNHVLLDLGIDAEGKEVSIKPLNLRYLPKVTQKKSTETLIENSYEMKRLQEDLKTLESQRNMTSGTARKQYEANLELKKIEIKEKRTELEKKINDLYLQADQAYEAMINAEKELTYTDEDYHKLSVQYRLGLISKFDYEQAMMMIDAANVEYKQALLNYYKIIQQIEALERGYIS